MKKIQLSKLTSLLSFLFFGLALWLLRGELRDFKYRDIINFFHDLPGEIGAEIEHGHDHAPEFQAVVDVSGFKALHIA